jgi:hypothetical protein
MGEKHKNKTNDNLLATENVRWVFDRNSKLLVPKRKRRTGFEGKTLWDWLQLLIVPIMLAGGGYLFGAWQHDADQQQALDQQQAAILQTYIDNIQDLLLNHDLLKSKPDDDVATLARARTLTALQGLDRVRKARSLIFLYEAKLIGYVDTYGNAYKPIIRLGYASLREADLRSASLSGADLTDVDLSYADLSWATLADTNLDITRLSHANLFGTYLFGARNLTQQELDQVATCKEAVLPKGLTCHRNQ